MVRPRRCKAELWVEIANAIQHGERRIPLLHMRNSSLKHTPRVAPIPVLLVRSNSADSIHANHRLTNMKGKGHQPEATDAALSYLQCDTSGSVVGFRTDNDLRLHRIEGSVGHKGPPSQSFHILPW